jgi:hypothetical protein
VYNFFHSTNYAHNLRRKQIMEKEEKKKKNVSDPPTWGRWTRAARAVAWSDRTLKWFCGLKPLSLLVILVIR